MKSHNTIDLQNPQYQYKSRNLPHWYDVDRPIFITYRLKFTLPPAIMLELNERKAEWFNELQSIEPELLQVKLATKDAAFFAWVDELIAKSPDVPQILHNQELTTIISDAFRYFDSIRYRLLAYCVMPNHVHVLISPLGQSNGTVYPLSRITYSWKKYTATEINRKLGNSGNLWQHESYDHLVRDDAELAQVIDYIVQNPVKAGLVDNWEDWHGTWVVEQHLP